MQTHTSRSLIVLTAAFALAGSLAVVAHAQDEERHAPPAGRNGPAAHAAGAAPTLEHEMSAIGRAFKGLNRQVKDASKNADSLKLAQQFEMHVATAKTLLPEKIEKAPEADRAKLTEDYRKDMSQLLRDALDLEDQLANNENDKAAETLKKLGNIEKEGHQEFRPRKHD